VNNSAARRKFFLAWFGNSGFSSAAFAHRPATNFENRRWTSVTKPSGQAARFVQNEYSRIQRPERFTINASPDLASAKAL
jgi:hypothetical protein